MIDYRSYISCLKDVFQKEEKERINFFLRENQIFKGFDKDVFLRRYYSFFIWESAPRYGYILQEGKPSTHVYFIKRGEYEITLTKSLNEISDLIKDIAGKSIEIPNQNIKLFRNYELAKFMNEKKIIKVIIL